MLSSIRAKRHHVGYTLVELLIVVSIIGMLQAIAVPNLLRSRASVQARSCAANLVQIQAAKEQWALESRVPATAAPRPEDLYGPTGYVRAAPLCPCGGTYLIGNLMTAPTCGIGDNNTPFDPRDDHVLP
jgi:prepilin-type N-terminal cleavage/methylation domain-containing protein